MIFLIIQYLSLKLSSRTGDLESFLCEHTGVDRNAVLAYLSDGRRLTNDNVRDIASAQDEVLLHAFLNFAIIVLKKPSRQFMSSINIIWMMIYKMCCVNFAWNLHFSHLSKVHKLVNFTVFDIS